MQISWNPVIIYLIYTHIFSLRLSPRTRFFLILYFHFSSLFLLLFAVVFFQTNHSLGRAVHFGPEIKCSTKPRVDGSRRAICVAKRIQTYHFALQINRWTKRKSGAESSAHRIFMGMSHRRHIEITSLACLGPSRSRHCSPVYSSLTRSLDRVSTFCNSF